MDTMKMVLDNYRQHPDSLTSTEFLYYDKTDTLGSTAISTITGRMSNAIL